MAGQCAAMAAMKDLDEIYEHMNEFCVDCAEAQLEEAANGEELIFTDGPPSWIVAQEAEEAAAKEAREKQEEMERKRKAMEKKREEKRAKSGEGSKITWHSAEETKKIEIRKMAGELSDKHLEHEIKKLMKVDDAEAAKMRLELKREVALKRKEKEKEKEKEETKHQKEEQKKNSVGLKEPNKLQKRPWQPQILKAIAIGDERRSALSVDEQKRYVAIVANYHAIDTRTRFEQNRKEIKMYDERLAEERVLVDEMVRAALNTETISIQEVQKEVDGVLTRWSSRYVNDQRRFVRVKQLPWRAEAETPSTAGVLKPTLERLLMAAPNPKLMLPNMHDRVNVSYEPYRFDPRNKNKIDISKDRVVHSLCSDTGCTIAMECTTAVHLMSRPGEPRNYAYNVPVSVFDQFIGGCVVRMCFLGKPRPQSGVSNRTLLHMVAKYRAKSTFTKKEEASSKPSKDTVAPVAKDTVATSSEKKEEGGGLSLIDDLLGSIMAPSTSTLASKEGVAAAKASSTDHSYGLFTIPSFSLPETRVIIRSSPCPRNEATGGTEYSLAAKVEYAHDAGVTRETFEEMLWTSMKAVFKGAVNSATIHMHPYMKDALQITHSRAIPLGTHQNEDFFPLLSTRTNHLSRLLGELSQLEPAEYLLQVSPTSDEMTIFRENRTGNELFFNKAPRRMPGPLKAADSFTGIDDKRVLHWQVMQGRAPLSLWPEGHTMLKIHENAKMNAEKGGQRGVKRPFQHSPKKDRSSMTDEERKQNNYLRKQHKKKNRGGGAGSWMNRGDLHRPQ